MSKRGKSTTTTPQESLREPSKLRLNSALGIILLLAAAAVIRDLYLLQYRAALPYYKIPILDSTYYDQWAQRVASGQGYGPMPFYMAPLYPYFLALIYKLAGHSLPIVYAVQQGLGLVNLLLVYQLGKRTFGHVPGLVAAGFLMLYGPVMYLESKLLSETLGLTLGLASMLLMVRAIERPSSRRFLSAGVLVGLSALCRPAVPLLAVILTAWLLIRRKGLREIGIRPAHTAALAAGIALAIAPVTIRNCTVGKGFALISTNSGIVFAQANNPLATGIEMPMAGFTTDIGTQQQEEMRLASEALGHPVDAVESSSYWLREGMRFIRENPGDYLLLAGRKLLWALHSREAGSNYNINFEREFVPVLGFLILPFTVFSGFGLYGLIRGLRSGVRPQAEVLGLQILSVLLGLVIFSVSSRYRAPMVPALAVFAGFGLVQVAEQVRAREWRRLGIAALWIAPMFLLSLVPYPTQKITASDPGNLGVTYMEAGEMQPAVKYLRQALELNSGSSLAHLNMGVALARLGRHEEATDFLRRGISIAPNDERLYFELGNNLVMGGRRSEAIAEYRRALEINPGNHGTRVVLGAVYASLRMFDQAENEFREAIRLKPDLGVAHFDLAWTLYHKGRYAEAWRALRQSEQHGWKPDPAFVKSLRNKVPDPEPK